MGRIKTLLIKRIAKKLIKEYGPEFTPEFNSNKPLVQKYTNVESHKMRNMIAGYTARLIKQKIALGDGPKRRVNEEDLSKFYQ